MNENEISEMIELAMQARTKAYAPYSNFQVGACVKMENGSYYTGCNIENASYGATNCAERTAVFKAVSEGVMEFDAICVVGGMNKIMKEYAAPCGVCRQVMMEFAEQGCVIVVAKNKQEYRMYSVEELLPETFHLNKEE